LPGNLRDRLKRIQLVKKEGITARGTNSAGGGDISFFTGQGWVPAGYLTLRYEVTANEDIVLSAAMPEAAGIVMPGISDTTAYEDLFFFDLETSGLSGGAGTLAFLAAFGRLIHAGGAGPNMAGPKTTRYKLRITQYLLLDYPGENDFVKALLGEFNSNGVMVSYNGKSFDSQILKTRCLMNGMIPPEYRHADLLHPARRLWKRILPDCSQGTIETAILGIDRTGDIPGAMAPEIWFSFLRNGDDGDEGKATKAALLKIAGHNRRDISGLASILRAMTRIAADPLAAMKTINFDLESLAIRWHAMDNKTGHRFLRYAAETGHPRAGLSYAFALLKAGNYDEGREWLLKTASAGQPPSQTAALRALAIDSEHRLKNAEEALSFTEQGLELLASGSPRREEFERRLLRLRQKKNCIICAR
jgi:uncharacterized protein YprB with RNaseH-like and TPR domain